MTVRRAPHRFTVPEYERMVDLGILKEDARVELIRGEIVAKMPIGDAHIAAVNRLTRLFVRAVGDAAIVSIQNPVRMADSEPEPDVALLRPRADDYAGGKAGPADILLLVEVAETSLEDDREVKGPLYAEAGITEYWIVNLVDRCLEVYRGPQPTGTYADVRTVRPGDQVEVAALAGLTVDVTALLGG
jgi:Uma2 family endonuclease